MKFVISRREAKLSTNMSFRTEFHGEDPVTAGDVSINEMMLEGAELGALMEEPRAFDVLYCARPNSTLHDPVFPSLKPLKLTTTLEEAFVKLWVGVAEDQQLIDLGRCTLKSFTLDRRKGGLTAVSFMIQSTPTLDRRVGELLSHLSAGIWLEVSYTHSGKQQEAPLEGGSGEKPKRGRKKQTGQPTAPLGFDGSHLVKPAAAETPAHVADPDDPEYVPGPMDQAAAN